MSFPFRKVLLPILPFLTFVAACAPISKDIAPPIAFHENECQKNPQMVYKIKTRPVVTKQGATVALDLRATGGWAVDERVPISCLINVRSSNPRYARVSPDQKSLIIAQNAPIGSEVTVTGNIRTNNQVATAQITVLDGNLTYLVGRYRQSKSDHCINPGLHSDGDNNVGELELKRNNTALLTFHPFESYVDFVGTYSFDQTTHDLVLDFPEMPPSLRRQKGKAELTADGKLVLTGFEFSKQDYDMSNPPTCKKTFEPIYY